MLHLSRRCWQRTPKTDFCACWHPKQQSWDTWDTFFKPLRIRKKEILHYAKDFQNTVPSVPTSPLRPARDRNRHQHRTPNQLPMNSSTPPKTEPTATATVRRDRIGQYLELNTPCCNRLVIHAPPFAASMGSYSRRTCDNCGAGYWIHRAAPLDIQPSL